MGHFAEASLEECVTELADRVIRDVQNMTPLQSHDYFLCRSIDTLIFMQSTGKPATGHRSPANESLLNGSAKATNILPFRRHRVVAS